MRPCPKTTVGSTAKWLTQSWNRLHIHVGEYSAMKFTHMYNHGSKCRVSAYVPQVACHLTSSLCL